MIINNLQNPYSINEVYASKPLRNESSSYSANSMPTQGRIVTETGVTKRPLNNEPPNFIRHVYVNNQTASNGSLTESFIRSRASLSPSYFHNEIVTRYNMISAIPKNITQLKKSFEKLA
ncbi:MAG: hypothetical protein CMM64_02865 [Rhodospirillaceae bacterium]|nr:hypothetical protein [Rhodospirillaceae bacterium]|tara:strand:- start:1101 stop:1457 length:357 start_codon:yes stop_codon:yes gene_type:complete